MAVSPVILLVKLPVPLPFVVWLSLTVGFCEVFQQMPRAVTEAPPVAVTFPPQVAVLAVTLLTVLVVTVGNVAEDSPPPPESRRQRTENPEFLPKSVLSTLASWEYRPRSQAL